MAKISLVLVFSVVLALPFRAVLGQDDWKDLLSQGGLSQDALDQARKAIGGAAAQSAMGGASAQDAVSDYFGSALSGASSDDSDDSSSSSSSSFYEDTDEGQGSSLADFLDTEA